MLSGRDGLGLTQTSDRSSGSPARLPSPPCPIAPWKLVIKGVMSDGISLLKARYCRSILKTASIASDQEARRLIGGLTTERQTDGTTESVASAEKLALSAIDGLAKQLQAKRGGFAPTDWSRAEQAVESWLRAAGE